MSAYVWALLAATCWGVAPLLEKAGLRGPVDPTAGVFIRSLGVAAAAACFLLWVPDLTKHLSAMPRRQWVFLGLGGVMASILGQICFYRALQTGEVSRVVPLGASYPVLACLLGLVLLKEPITFSKACGIVLVVAGTYLLR